MKPNTLYVYKGFSKEFLNEIQKDKLFSVPFTIEITDLDQSKARMLPEIFEKINGAGQVFWCTYEEFLLIGEDILSLYFNIEIIENNLFHKCYPMIYEIPSKERLLNTFYDEETIEPEFDDDQVLSVVQKYYGRLKKLRNQWYVVYAVDLPGKEYYKTTRYKINERKLLEHENADLELSEEEDEFLILIQKLLSGEFSKREILISHSGDIDSFPHNYRNRLLVLQELFPSIEISLVTKMTDTAPSINEEDYLKILKKYWGYNEFRTLKMYKDVHDPEFKKEIVFISQAQIIDDIVKQSIAAYQNQPYKDVFVTSPTGAGKSIMFQIPAIYLAEKYKLMTIVISPLIGLMTDQVQGLENRNITISATINSEITPVKKMEIIEKIKSGDISILYISPETLLSRSDITQLIGNRTVGLFVIDEAHIVTTWGKAFRSDYWYLGNYLQRLRRDMSFPVATFTATVIYGGIEDMYAETRDSLNLINPISYFGYVKRDDIEVRIKQKDETESKFKEYLMEKFKILTYRLETFLSKRQKTLVYFPTVNLIHQYLEFANIYGSETLIENITYYYGPLAKEQKHSNYLRFKNNESLIMLATKAFGMGIDIPDIMNVYHFAPTGNVCDYVQEIGRAARALEQGYAYFDFLPKDFVHVNRLHGISTIRKHQLIQVMEKIIRLLEQEDNRKNKRHLLVNAEEFRYIFQQSNNSDAGDDDVDNKLKTALLIIEKDFKAKLGYSPIIARPRSLFSTEFFMIEKGIESEVIKKYGSYFSKIRDEKKDAYGPIYSLDLKKLWETKYSNYSFPEFKYKFHSKKPELNIPFLDRIIPVFQIKVNSREKNTENLFYSINSYLNKLSQVLGEYMKSGKYFSVNDFSKEIQKLIGGDKYFCDNLASVVIHSAENYERIMKKHSNFYNRFISFNENRNLYSIQNGGYAGFIDSLRNLSKQMFKPSNCTDTLGLSYEVFLPKLNQENVQKTFVFLGILEALGLIVYSVSGGDNPEIFIRINSKLQIERIVQNPQKYQNFILENVHQRHKISVAMLTYLFKNQVANDVFWEHIENYFLGKIPDEVWSMSQLL